MRSLLLKKLKINEKGGEIRFEPSLLVEDKKGATR